MVIGFVGLGIMGKPMAKNLCRAGYTLIVNDHHKENVDELVQAGARSGDLKQIGMESDVVITMLPNSPQVKDVMLGENGIAGYMKKGTCFIDMSSINPVDSRYIGDVLKEKGIDMLDAPVSQELLETIFYVGTRLHDGAVVIRGNIIVAASVYYTPTTRALTGKFGSRHRAAFGISEISDSVTVVVSEETGRVSIAYNGNLETVPLDSFLREFSDLMNMDK